MSTFLPLFDWTMTERVAKATGFNPDTSPEAKYIYALCNLSDEEADRAFKRMMAHQDSIAERTIDAVRREKNLNDLCSLIDAAANQDGARIAQSAAGQFLRRIAELAMSAINTTGDQRND